MSNLVLPRCSPLQLVSSARELRAAVAQSRKAGRSIGLAPTMGALHEGHLSLVRASVAEGRFTVVTVFVNPTQFGPHEDYQHYPRTLSQDVELLAAAGAELVFAPEPAEIYPPGFSTYIEPPRVALPLEGHFRPGHFRGVATVVLKLFNLAAADVAYFGQKDYQQSLVIRRLVADLNVPIEVRVCPTVREADGLAMSSRNAYLNADERRQALALSRSLYVAEDLVAGGQREPGVVLACMKQVLAEADLAQVDYIALADPETLEDAVDLAQPAIALVAAHVGETRLIDNLRIGGQTMRQTLFWIPEKLPDEWGGAPLFGFGLFLAVWAVASTGLMAWQIWRHGWNDESRSYVPILLVIGAGILFVAPFIVESGVGLPIRGYGVLVTLGVISGVCLAAWQARRMGLDPEIIYSLAGWMFVGGIGGARVFYVIQYWDQFYDPQSTWLTLCAIANITKGGLVVYGSVIGGVAALVVYCRLRKLPLLAIGDLIAPGMLVGLAFGRVGCLLNGCCYGGLCEDRNLPAIVFPRFADERAGKTSDPYAHQQSLGLLHGFRLGIRNGRVIVDDVRADSPGGHSGLMAGQVVQRIDLDPESAVFAALTVAELAGSELEIETSSGEKIFVPITRRSGEKSDQRSPNVVGFELLDVRDNSRPVVDSVAKGSLAERAGLKAGQRVESIRLPAVKSLTAARGILVYARESLVIETADGKRHGILLSGLPNYSRPVHPTQIYSSIKASLMALFLWSYYPFRRRDGEVFALMLMIYPLFRILLEVIRDDVPGLLGTPITISQAVSGVILVAGIWLFAVLSRRPRGSVLPA